MPSPIPTCSLPPRHDWASKPATPSWWAIACGICWPHAEPGRSASDCSRAATARRNWSAPAPTASTRIPRICCGTWMKSACGLMVDVGDEVPLEAATLAGAMADLNRRGFTEHFTVVHDRLRAVEKGQTFSPDHVVVAEYHRFEGVSDPDDMAILYGLETRDGVRGTLTDAFGSYADPLVGAFMRTVPVRAPRRS